MNKQMICTAAGAVGGFIASAFGGFDAAMITLLIFMTADYITGLLVAGVFHASPKSETGALESKAGFKGLVRKGMTLLFVLIAFIVNELISIVENGGLMGVPIPEPIMDAIEVLKKKGDDDGNNTGFLK